MSLISELKEIRGQLLESNKPSGLFDAVLVYVRRMDNPLEYTGPYREEVMQIIDPDSLHKIALEENKHRSKIKRMKKLMALGYGLREAKMKVEEEMIWEIGTAPKRWRLEYTSPMLDSILDMCVKSVVLSTAPAIIIRLRGRLKLRWMR